MGHVERPAWNLLTGTLTTYVLLFVNIVIGIFLMPFTMRHLGQAEYGLWMLAASMTAYLQILDLGYGNGVVRQVTQADARGDEEEMNVILSTFAVVYGAIALAALAVVAAIAFAVVPRFPNLSPAQVPTAQWVVLILGLRAAIAFPMGIFGAVITARQRFAAASGIAIVVALLQAATTYAVLSAGYGLVTLVTATTAIGLASYGAYAAVARATFPGLRLSASRFSAGQVRQVTAFSFYLFLISIAIHVSLNVDNLIIGAYLGTSAIAIYTVAFRLAEYQRQLCGQFSGFLFPLIVRFDAARNAEALRVTLVDGTRLALALVTAVTICLFAFGSRIVNLWMGADFSGSVGPLYLLAIAGVVMVAQGPAGNTLLATGRHRLVAAVSIVTIMLNVALSIGLVSRYGLVGVAVGTLVPYALLNLGIVMPAACRSVRLPVGAFAASVLTPSAVAALPAAAVAILLRAAVLPASLLTAAGLCAVVVGAFAVTFCLVGLQRDDRLRYLAAVTRTGTVERPEALTP